MIDYTKILPGLPAFFSARSTAHHKNLPFEDYAGLPALNASVLKCRTPLDMLYAMRSPEDRPQKDCFDLGGNLHCATLEPERWQQSLIVLPDDAPKRPTQRQIDAKKPSTETKEAIAWWAEFDAKFQDRTVLSAEDHDQVMQMSKALHRHHEKIRKVIIVFL